MGNMYYFEKLLIKSKGPALKEMDKELKWKLNTLKTAISQVVKELD